jgi:hypothetical protein
VYLFIHLYVSTSNIYRCTPPSTVSLHPVSFHLQPIPFHSTLHRLTPPCTVSLHPAPFHSTLHRFTPPCTVSLHPVPFHSTLYSFTPPCTVSLHPVPLHSTLYCFIPPCTVSLHLYRFTPPCTYSCPFCTGTVPFHLLHLISCNLFTSVLYLFSSIQYSTYLFTFLQCSGSVTF